MNPKDKQNVPTAVKLLQTIINASNEEINNIHQLQTDISNEIKLLAKLLELSLTFFTNPQINLIDQLLSLAIFSHLLLYIY